MKIKGLLLGLGLMQAVMLSSIYSYAAEKVAVVQEHTGESELSLYVDTNGMDIKEVECQIGRQACEDIIVTPVSEKEVPMRTLILLDNSLSIAEKYRPQIYEIIGGVIDGHLEGEEFALATIDTDIHYIAEYSTDYEALKKNLNEISYNNQDTYFTDILYEVIGDIAKEETDIYTRIIAVCDGADDMRIGIKSEEVTDLLKNKNVPVYALGVVYQNNEERLRNMFALSRATGAEYFNLDEVSDLNEVANVLGLDRKLLSVVVNLPEELLDGSEKSLKLTVVTSEGSSEATADVRMPFGDAVANQPEVIETSEPTPEPTQEPTPEPTPEPAEEEPESTVSPMQIGLALVIVLLGVVLLMMQKKKKSKSYMKEQKKQNNIPKKLEGAKEPSGKIQSMSESMTIMGSDVEEDNDEDKTVLLGDFEQYQDNEISHTIIITDNRYPDVTHRFNTKERIVIGRDRSLNNLAYPMDSKVSGQHCYIEAEQNGDLILVDLNSTNGTYCDGVRVNGRKSITNGSVITVGETKLNLKILN